MAKTTNWVGTSSQNWSAATWSNGAPATGDTVTLTAAHTLTLDVDTPSLATLTVNSGSTLTASASHTITTTSGLVDNGTVSVYGGTLTIASSVTGSGTLTAGRGATAGTLLLNGASTIKSVTYGGTATASKIEIGATGSLTVSGTAATTVSSHTLQLDGSSSFFTNGHGVTLTTGTITGLGTVHANVSATGAAHITANGGKLEINGTITNGNGGAIALTVTGANDTLLLDGTSSATSVSFNSSTGTLEVGASGALTVANALAVGAGKVKLDAAGTVQLTDTNGLTLAGGTISGTGTIATATTLSGYGTVGIALLGGTGTVGSITASGGTLDLQGAVNQTGSTLRTLTIGTAANSVLKIDGTASSSSAIGLTNANQTLEIGSTGALNISAAQTTTAGHIVLDAGSNLTVSGASHALTIGAGGLSGAGQVKLGANTLTGSGTITASGGNLTFTTTGSVNGTATTFAFDIANGSTFTVAGVGNLVGATQAPTLTFVTTNQTAAENFIDTDAVAGNVHLGTITGFSSHDGTYAHSDTIQLASFGSSDTISNVTANSITISGNGHSQTFNFSGVNTAAIHLSDVGGVNTLTICFMAGTMIRTPDGEAAIETLNVGDRVMTSDGVAKKVNWLGKQTVSTLFADPIRSFPIRVKAGALADNVPSRDLLVSPDHALLVDGVLIHAGALVNGTSITRETNVPKVFVYYHIELDDHSLILAENTPAETFVDNIDRMNFDNWAEFEALYPEGKAVEELPYPRAKAHRQVPVYIRVALAERAQAIGAVEANVA